MLCLTAEMCCNGAAHVADQMKHSCQLLDESVSIQENLNKVGALGCIAVLRVRCIVVYCGLKLTE